MVAPSDLPEMPATTLSATAAETASAAVAAAQVADDGCVAPSCQWAVQTESGCRSARLPDESLRPEAIATDAPDLEPFYLAFKRLWLGESLITGEADAAPWRTWGFDQDQQCTRSATCEASAAAAESCTRMTAVAQPDADFCSDNAFAELQQTAANVANLGAALGIREQDINCALHHGEYNQLFRISDYNGQSDDDAIRLDVYDSPGLDTLNETWTCPLADYESAHPQWLPSQSWQIASSSLSSPMSTPGMSTPGMSTPGMSTSGMSTSGMSTSGVLPAANVTSTYAFLRDGYLIAHLAANYHLQLASVRSSYPYWRFSMGPTWIVGRLERDDSQVWQIRDGMLASRQEVSAVLDAFHGAGVCPNGNLAPVYPVVEAHLRASADLSFQALGDESATCNAISTNIPFTATMASAGAVVDTDPIVDCCLPENEGMGRCPSATCGDGTLDVHERCDVAIPEGEPGACPKTCPQLTPCVPRELLGKLCQSQCVEVPISAPRDGDECCPEGANASNDSDCERACGNGVLEQDETCEPATLACPNADSCVSNHACLVATYSGVAAECNARCDFADIEACVNGDGCCANGCSADNDSDCSSTCGNGVVEAQETCDGDCVSECPATASDYCSRQLLRGQASQCTAECIMVDMASCQNDDGCCPGACHANNDNDCPALCGNNVREDAEACDDGNTAAGDGCDEKCQLESAAATCAQSSTVEGNAGFTESCAGCACEACPLLWQRCFASADPAKNQLCAEALACKVASGCFGITCVGPALGPPGPCFEQVIAASGDVSPSQLLAAGQDASTALGSANELRSCLNSSCGAECAAQ